MYKEGRKTSVVATVSGGECGGRQRLDTNGQEGSTDCTGLSGCRSPCSEKSLGILTFQGQDCRDVTYMEQDHSGRCEKNKLKGAQAEVEQPVQRPWQ